MSDGALSQNEINAMLKGEIDLNAVSKDGDIPQDDINLLLNAIDVHEKKQTKDFSMENRQLRFSDAQLKKIASVYENFAHMAMNCLSTVLRCPVQMRLDTINQLTVGEVSRCIPTPTTLGFINMEPLKGGTNPVCAVIEIDPNVTFAVIDITRHGRTGMTNSYSVFTNFEISIINNLFAYILENMRLAWSGTINIQPKLCRLETDPKSIKIAAIHEMTALATIAVKIMNIDGMINFCIPFSVIEPVLDK